MSILTSFKGGWHEWERCYIRRIKLFLSLTHFVSILFSCFLTWNCSFMALTYCSLGLGLNFLPITICYFRFEHYYRIGLSRFSEAVIPRCSVKKMFLKIWQNSQENTCARVVRVPQPPTPLRKRLRNRYFAINFVKFLRMPFFKNTFGSHFWIFSFYPFKSLLSGTKR